MCYRKGSGRNKLLTFAIAVSLLAGVTLGVGLAALYHGLWWSGVPAIVGGVVQLDIAREMFMEWEGME